MSKKEGEILQGYLKANNINIGKFATAVGFGGRQGLYYQFQKDNLDQEFKEKVASVLGVTLDQIFSSQVSSQGNDGEKETLKELVRAQQELIKNFKSFVVAQLIRIEAHDQVVLARIAELEVLLDGEKKDRGLSAVLDEGKQDVQEKISEIQRQIGI